MSCDFVLRTLSCTNTSTGDHLTRASREKKKKKKRIPNKHQKKKRKKKQRFCALGSINIMPIVSHSEQKSWIRFCLEVERNLIFSWAPLYYGLIPTSANENFTSHATTLRAAFSIPERCACIVKHQA